jgi:HEXXH motif-containing protein
MSKVEPKNAEAGNWTANQSSVGSFPATSLASCFRGFSCPDEKFDELFFETVITSYAQEVVRLFLQTYVEELEQKARGLTILLRDWLAGESSSATVCHPAFGGAFRAIAGRNAEPIDSAVGLALRLCARGSAADWEAQLGRPTRLLWDNWLLPRADALRVHSDGSHAFLSLSLRRIRREAEFTRAGHGWRGTGAEAMHRIGPPSAKITLLPADSVGAHNFQDLNLPMLEKIGKKDVQFCRQALEILEAHAPAYYQWVFRIVRQVVLLRPENEVLRSGGESNLLTLIYMSCVAKPMALAEMLVHEASHHYFNLLCRIGPPDDGTDKNLYFSPALNRSRPLDRILIAYHAFANVSLLYQLCLDSGVADDGYCRAAQSQILRQLKQLESPLRDNPALTPIGRALFEPLFSRLH